ncbi:MAG TPA: thioredoxin domain-containing protein [bacterium]|nr:thioredoxin domain-containing protein [bacterium]
MIDPATLMTRWALRALLLCCLLGLLAAPAAAQKPTPGDLTARVTELESKVALLESEVAAMRDRMEAVLGSDPSSKVQNVTIGDSPIRGNPNAPITLVMFGDYQSDYSARAQYVVKKLLEAYPQQLRFVYKHYPLTQQHPMANDAALAALAAEKQGLFWQYHDLLFQNSRRLDNNLLLVLAEQAGVDLSRFDRDRRSLAALERLQADEKEGAQLGVAGLPTLYLNGRLMPTWRFDYLQTKINELIGK